MQEAFHVVPLTISDWLLTLGLGAALLIIMECTKLALRIRRPAEATFESHAQRVPVHP
jgi:hypothetical protein